MSVYVVCGQLEVSATVQESPNDCVLLLCRQLEVSATVLGSLNECVCCLLSVRGLCDGPWES